ncbi:hypothetical protein [Streptomyces tanashiensis]|uniref:Oxidoreductase n=1 Tax=Streptomyces tanashiensis TaxID=67367 RepID=A0ABY6QVC7_9ACTN|nr:hypothetical protein [Streptomyces tanashiensis]UZX20622.1 hypothetical protein LDH80_07835 [Streptomyces tanashiensis]GGY37569.1 hypothetical protein GCM10010299_50060 [Streptomyces tanashiensis]
MPVPYTPLDLVSAARPGGEHLHHDFLVDGRPLLHRLDETDGFDTVSPLAADIPPTVRAEHAHRLLLADGSRQVIHSCPDCEDPGCGAVTAVVAREGGDVVWRDFAWQTGPTADPEREGYPGVGPYRFHAATYRSVLLRLLESSACRRVA